MSWGYWGIVTGLALLLGMSLFSVAWVYGSARGLTHMKSDLKEADPASKGDDERKRAA